MPSGRKVFFPDAYRVTDESRLRICVPASDVIDGNIGEGVKEILSTLRTRNGEKGSDHIRLVSRTDAIMFSARDLGFHQI